MKNLASIVKYYYEKHQQDPTIFIEGTILHQMDSLLADEDLSKEEKDFLMESIDKHSNTLKKRTEMIHQLERNKDELQTKNEELKNSTELLSKQKEEISHELELEKQLTLKIKKQESQGRITSIVVICAFVMVMGPLLIYAKNPANEDLLTTYKDLSLIVLGAFLATLTQYAGVNNNSGNSKPLSNN